MKGKKGCGIAVLILVGAVVLCRLAGMFVPDEDVQREAELKATPVNAAKSAITGTAKTATPSSDGLSGGCQVEKDLAEYSRVVHPYMESYSKALDSLGGLLSNPEIGEESWTKQVAEQLAIIRLLSEKLRRLDVPDSMRKLHGMLLAATNDFDAMIDHLIKGVDELDEDEIYRAQALIESGSDKLGIFIDSFEELVANPCQ